MHPLSWYRVDGPVSSTGFDLLQVWRQGAGTWRTIARDSVDDTEWYVVGPYWKTKEQALVSAMFGPDLAVYRGESPPPKQSCPKCGHDQAEPYSGPVPITPPF